jgi:multidrug resistance efflux pump
MAQHKLEHARLKLQQMSLSAPEAGTVVGQVPGLGAFVQAGKPAISCCRRARCRYVPNSARPTPMPCRWA